MLKGFRLEGLIGKDRTSRTVKPVWGYTAGELKGKNASWLTDKANNADMLTREGDAFDLSLKHHKKIMTVAIPENYMRIGPMKAKDYLESFRIFWYTDESKGVDDFWRMVVFYHVTIQRTELREVRGIGFNGSYYEVVMKIDANIDYLDKYGTKAQ